MHICTHIHSDVGHDSFICHAILVDSVAYVCVHAHIYVYIYICIHIYSHVGHDSFTYDAILEDSSIYMCIHLYVYIYIHIYMHIHTFRRGTWLVYMWRHIGRFCYICVYSCTYLRTYIYVYTYIHICKLIHPDVGHDSIICDAILVDSAMYICIHVHIHVYRVAKTHRIR